jgi:hypothetical protein
VETVPKTGKEGRLAALRAALDQGTMRQAHRMVNALHPGEVASLLESLPPAQRELVWEFVDPEIEGEVLVELNENVRQALIEGMDAEELVAAAEGMETDDLADLVTTTAALDGPAGSRTPARGARLPAGHRRRPHEHGRGQRARRRHHRGGAALPAHARRAARQDGPAVRRRPQ